MIRILMSLGCLLLLLCCTSMGDPKDGAKKQPTVVLDIGHYVDGGKGTGARGKTAKGEVIEETEFWYMNVGYIYAVIKKSGYNCLVINRGNKPEDKKFMELAKDVPIIHLGKPDTHDKRGVPIRYPSKYFADFIGAGMICADYAIEQKTACVIFLHHNSITPNTNVFSSTLFYGKLHGAKLAESMAGAINAEVLAGANPMPNGGKSCKTAVRAHPQMGGGWLSACDASKIPAVVVEATVLSTPAHVEWLSNKDNAKRYAETLGRGIVRFMVETHGQQF